MFFVSSSNYEEIGWIPDCSGCALLVYFQALRLIHRYNCHWKCCFFQRSQWLGSSTNVPCEVSRPVLEPAFHGLTPQADLQNCKSFSIDSGRDEVGLYQHSTGTLCLSSCSPFSLKSVQFMSCKWGEKFYCRGFVKYFTFLWPLQLDKGIREIVNIGTSGHHEGVLGWTG